MYIWWGKIQHCHSLTSNTQCIQDQQKVLVVEVWIYAIPNFKMYQGCWGTTHATLFATSLLVDVRHKRASFFLKKSKRRKHRASHHSQHSASKTKCETKTIEEVNLCHLRTMITESTHTGNSHPSKVVAPFSKWKLSLKKCDRLCNGTHRKLRDILETFGGEFDKTNPIRSQNLM